MYAELSLVKEHFVHRYQFRTSFIALKKLIEECIAEKFSTGNIV